MSEESKILAVVWQKFASFTIRIGQFANNKVQVLWQQAKLLSNKTWREGGFRLRDMQTKLQNSKQKWALGKRPWYLVIGPENTGKKAMLANAGLYFHPAEYYGNEAINYLKQFSDYDWWFTEQAVFINAMLPQEDRSVTEWKRFVKLLRRMRKSRPINGMVLTLSLPDILLYSNQQRQGLVHQVSQFIRDIHHQFKAQVPVYLVFTKCDLIEGFLEYFNDLSKEELQQIWGLTFPLESATDMNAVIRFFCQQYSSLVDQLRKRVLWTLDAERNPRGRELIYSFPQQMQLFKHQIENLIQELYGAVRYQNALQMRGVYFISSTQEGQTHDFLLRVMSKKFQLVPPKCSRPSRLGECYFLKHLFYNVLFKESSLLGASERSKRIHKWAYRGAQWGIPLSALLLTVGMYQGEQENYAKLHTVQYYLNNYQLGVAQLGQKKTTSLLSMLPLLDKIDAATRLYQDNHKIGVRLLWRSYLIGHDLKTTRERMLRTQWMPRVAATLEHALNSNIQDQNLLYATLKGYLAFSAQDYTNRNAIRAPMEYRWSKLLINSPRKNISLRYYLNSALNNKTEKLPIDYILVNRIRSQLETIVPAERAYGLLALQAKVSDYPNLVLTGSVGNLFNDVFSATRGNETIPVLYTYDGYRHIFLHKQESIAAEVVEDNRAIGLSAISRETQNNQDQITRQMQISYSKNTIAAWDNALAHVKVKPFDSLNQAVRTMAVLSGLESPLLKLLNIVYDNTTDVGRDNIQVSKHYRAMNNFTRNHADNVTWQSVSKTIENVRDFVQSIVKQRDQDQASYQAVVAAMQGKTSPILKLKQEALLAPTPIKGWILALANNSWNVLLQGAHRHLNALWHDQVFAEYQANIQGHYPIDTNADAQVNINAFNRFFGKNGTLEKFFNQYLKLFINTSSSGWKQYHVEGYTIGLPRHTVQMFTLAKQIRDQFFVSNRHKSELTMTMMPVALDGRATSGTLIVGNKQITYSHGPQHAMTVNWPLPENNQLAKVYINLFGGGQGNISRTGPWSLFKLIDQGHIKALDGDRYIVRYNLNNYYIAYEIKGVNSKSLFTLSTLKQFRLMAKVAP